MIDIAPNVFGIANLTVLALGLAVIGCVIGMAFLWLQVIELREKLETTMLIAQRANTRANAIRNKILGDMP